MNTLRVVVPLIDPGAIDSIFETPGRNDPCHCYSGKKYKRCCLEKDRAAWRTVALKAKQADAACILLRKVSSNETDYEPSRSFSE